MCVWVSECVRACVCVCVNCIYERVLVCLYMFLCVSVLEGVSGVCKHVYVYCIYERVLVCVYKSINVCVRVCE